MREKRVPGMGLNFVKIYDCKFQFNTPAERQLVLGPVIHQLAWERIVQSMRDIGIAVPRPAGWVVEELPVEDHEVEESIVEDEV